MKSMLKVVIMSVSVAVVLLVAWKLGLFGKEDDLKIDKTANVIVEIKKIGEFASACYYEEMVVKKYKRSDFNDSGLGKLRTMVTNGESVDEIVLIANGKVRAGFDLSEIDADKMYVSGDTLIMELPSARVFDVIMNPSNYEVYVETGTWDHSLVTSIQKEARDSLEYHALSSGLLKKAEEAGKNKLEDLFRAFGFRHIVMNVKQD